MSWKATAWASAQPAGDSLAKLILMLLADACPEPEGDRAWSCYVGLDRLAERGEMHRDTAMRAIRRLAERGHVSVEERKGMTNVYTLPVEFSTTPRANREVDSPTPRTDRDHPPHRTATTSRPRTATNQEVTEIEPRRARKSVVPNVPGAGNPVRSTSFCPECEGRGVADELTADGAAQPCPTCNPNAGW